jgi:hypothetical protein
MAFVACLWCETRLRPGIVTCPECGLQIPADDMSAAPKDCARTVVKRGRRLVLALVAVPLMLSAAYAARIGGFNLVSAQITAPSAASAVAALEPPAIYSDPLQREVWIGGVKAVEQVLAQPGYASFLGSYVDVAAGHVVSFCGVVTGTSGYDSVSGARRFVSVFGQTQSTTLESDDSSFDVLWARVCAQNESPA